MSKKICVKTEKILCPAVISDMIENNIEIS